MASRLRPFARSRFLVTFALVAIVAGIAGPAGATGAPGFDTKQPPMLIPVAPRAWVDPIMTVSVQPSEMIGGYRFEAIPDGISLRKAGGHTVEVFVNHETSTVPFPYNRATPNQGNSLNDFDNSQLSRLVIDTDDATVDAASMVITSDEAYQRFCSNFLATKEHGFSRQLLFTNEEAVDWVSRPPGSPSWSPAVVEGALSARQSGVVVAHDPKTGETKPIWGMGRLNHENSLALADYRKPVIVTGDDTFVTLPQFPAQSQMYMYIANDANAVWNDTGKLYAFVSNGVQQGYSDFKSDDPPGTFTTGQFIEVPKFIATGIDPATGGDLMAARAEQLLNEDPATAVPPGTYAVPTDGSFSRPPGTPQTGPDPVTGLPIPSVDGPQWVLERWSQLHGVFKFIRLEDMAYDKRSGMSNVVYVVDSGRGTAGATGPGISTNGRVWKMVLDKHDPKIVTSLSVLIEGDDSMVKTATEIHQPDNIESTKKGLYITEDPGSSQQFNYSEPQLADGRRTEARIWQYKLSTGTMSVIAKVDQSADEGPTDVDVPVLPLPAGASARGNLGAWEASGIIDVSDYFGPGTFLVTVQAHTLFVETGPGLDVTGDGVPDILNKREGGQLLLLHVPGG